MHASYGFTVHYFLSQGCKYGRTIATESAQQLRIKIRGVMNGAFGIQPQKQQFA